MRNVWMVGLLLCALPAGTLADKPKVSRAMVKTTEESMDQKFQTLWPDNPVQVVGLTQGAYINGYGAVFMSELNLATGPTISPFHPNISPDEVKRIHEKKVARLTQLKATMQQMLVDSAKSMDTVSADEQLALGISFFYWNWESREGLPAQIVMHAPKKLLLETTLAKASIPADEF